MTSTYITANITKSLNLGYLDYTVLDTHLITFSDGDTNEKLSGICVNKFGKNIDKFDLVQVADHITQTFYELGLFLAKNHYKHRKNTLIISGYHYDIENMKGFSHVDVEDVKSAVVNALLYFDTEYVLSFDLSDISGCLMDDIGMGFVGHSDVNNFEIYLGHANTLRELYGATDYCQF